jgi:hypothetical protein
MAASLVQASRDSDWRARRASLRSGQAWVAGPQRWYVMEDRQSRPTALLTRARSRFGRSCGPGSSWGGEFALRCMSRVMAGGWPHPPAVDWLQQARGPFSARARTWWARWYCKWYIMAGHCQGSVVPPVVTAWAVCRSGQLGSCSTTQMMSGLVDPEATRRCVAVWPGGRAAQGRRLGPL